VSHNRIVVITRRFEAESDCVVSILFYLLWFAAGLVLLITGVALLRENPRKSRLPVGTTYGAGANKHLLRSGAGISHGMVVDESGKLHAQSMLIDD